MGEGVSRRWIKEPTVERVQAFRGRGQIKPEQKELDWLPRVVVVKSEAESNVLKEP